MDKLKEQYQKGFADGQNEIINKTLLEIRRESIQIGREIAEEEHKAMCESCIHKVSAEDIKVIRNTAIDELINEVKNKYFCKVDSTFDNAILEIEKIAEKVKEKKNG